VGAPLAAIALANSRDQKPASPPPPPAAAKKVPTPDQALRPGETEASGSSSGLTFIKDQDGQVIGFRDPETNNPTYFPDGATQDESQKMVDEARSRIPKGGTAAAPVSSPAESSGSVVPLATGTPQNGDTSASSPTTTGNGQGTPLLTSDGTGLVLNSDGTITRSSKSSGTYRKNYGSSGGSSYGRGSSSKRKKKKGRSSSSASGMWEGFPFNRPPSSIRQLVLDAIAASQAKSKSKGR
jgi:hypothetical protein